MLVGVGAISIRVVKGLLSIERIAAATPLQNWYLKNECRKTSIFSIVAVHAANTANAR